MKKDNFTEKDRKLLNRLSKDMKELKSDLEETVPSYRIMKRGTSIMYKIHLGIIVAILVSLVVAFCYVKLEESQAGLSDKHYEYANEKEWNIYRLKGLLEDDEESLMSSQKYYSSRIGNHKLASNGEGTWIVVYTHGDTTVKVSDAFDNRDDAMDKLNEIEEDYLKDLEMIQYALEEIEQSEFTVERHIDYMGGNNRK